MKQTNKGLPLVVVLLVKLKLYMNDEMNLFLNNLHGVSWYQFAFTRGRIADELFDVKFNTPRDLITLQPQEQMPSAPQAQYQLTSQQITSPPTAAFGSSAICCKVHHTLCRPRIKICEHISLLCVFTFSLSFKYYIIVLLFTTFTL